MTNTTRISWNGNVIYIEREPQQVIYQHDPLDGELRELVIGLVAALEHAGEIVKVEGERCS